MSKLRIKIGALEFEYEGEVEFSHDSIKDLFSHMEGLSKNVDRHGPLTSDKSGAPAGIGASKIHTSTIAARLAAKSGTDLALASAAHLQLGLLKEVFTRQELLDDMKSAPTFFKSSMNNNLTKTIATLVTNQSFNQVGPNSYSLSDSKRSELERAIAEKG